MGNRKTRSKEIDMLNGSLWDKILLYALPIAATGILQQLFNAADVAVIGRFVGAGAMAAVGANAPIVSLVINLVVGIALGSNVVIANAIGRNSRDTVRKAVHTSLLFAFLLGLGFAIVGELFAVPIMNAMSVPADVLEMAILYLRIYLIGLPIIVLYNFESAIYRGIGDTRTPLMILTISGVINVVLNIFFVLVLKMTVDGVAWATVLSNMFSAVVLLVDLTRRESIIQIHWKEMRIDLPVLGRIIRIGLPAGIQGAVFAVANIIVQSAINSLGTIVMAASSAALNIEIMAYNVLNSFSQACTSFVSQNFGAGKIDRCKKVLRICFIEDAIALGTTIFLILFFGKTILSIFNSDPDVIDTGYLRLIMIFISYGFSMQYEMISSYMRAFNISVLPAVLTMVGIIAVRLFIIFVIFPLHRSFLTITLVYPISLAVTAVLMYIAVFITKPATKMQRKLNGV